jgi:hypothetical protein
MSGDDGRLTLKLQIEEIPCEHRVDRQLKAGVIGSTVKTVATVAAGVSQGSRPGTV